MAKKRDADGGSKPSKPAGKRTWKLMDRAATVVGGALATRATAVAWRGIAGKEPPTSGRHPEVTAREAVLWAMIGGGITELVKTGIRRGTATYWVRSTGELPPGMKPLSDPPAESLQDQAEQAPKKKRRRRR